MRALGRVREFVGKNAVMCIALAAAAASCFAVPFDRQYLSYFDWRTLTCLFCVLAVVCALKNVRFFYVLAAGIVRCFRHLHTAVLALVYVTFLGSMLIANDMALITFLPLGYLVLHTTGNERYTAFVFIMQNIAANLGGMLTPFGNPQNLYLYSHFSIPTGEFLRVMAPPFLLAVALITLCCLLFVRPIPLSLRKQEPPLPRGRVALYLALFALSIAIVFRAIPYWIGPLAVVPVLLVFDRRALRQVDYGLLMTFVFFFLFAGNISRLPGVQNFLGGLLSRHVLLTSVLCCQCISNVPTAILLSHFTENYRALLVGVNIGGVGTLIASLASLITFREYGAHDPAGRTKYIALFSLLNFGFLAVLCGFSWLLGYR